MLCPICAVAALPPSLNALYNKDELRRVCCMPGSEYKVFVGKPEGKNCVDERIILNFVVRNRVG
jgi:hypothetical protein